MIIFSTEGSARAKKLHRLTCNVGRKMFHQFKRFRSQACSHASTAQKDVQSSHSVLFIKMRNTLNYQCPVIILFFANNASRIHVLVHADIVD